MRSVVTYPKPMRELAKARGLHLVTIEALGMTLQAPASREHAQRIADLALEIFKENSAKKPGK